jgi:hypothetical protein
MDDRKKSGTDAGTGENCQLSRKIHWEGCPQTLFSVVKKAMEGIG